MQRQSEIIKSKQKPGKSSSTQQQPDQQQLPAVPGASTRKPTDSPQQSPSGLKIIRSKYPLCHYKFYLDICDHHLTKRIEDQIKALGGALEFFLTPSVTHFITDKIVLPPTVGNNNNTLSSRPGTPQTPSTPNTPQTPYSLDSKDNANSNVAQISKRTRISRADAILNRARRQSTTNAATASAVESPVATIKKDPTQPYLVWQTDYALHFFKKVQHELRNYLSSGRERKLNGKSFPGDATTLKGSGFIKIEAVKRNYRPYYQVFKKPTEWPKIDLLREDGAFRLSSKKPLEYQLTGEQSKKKMTRKSRSRSSQRQPPLPATLQTLKKGDEDVNKHSGAGQQKSAAGAGCKQQPKESSDKQCGVCEICKIEYDTLTIHLKTKDHEYFAKNAQNFIALDTLINDSADVSKFLSGDKKLNELEEMAVDDSMAPADAGTEDPLDDSSLSKLDDKQRANGPSPTLREKSKRSTKGKHSSEKFQNVLNRSSKSTSSSAKPTPTKPTATTPAKTAKPVRAVEHIPTPAAILPLPKRKASATSLVSPPIRAMLPPSSLYKVVETTEMRTPTRNNLAGDSAGAVGSPSLVVKFKKVRNTELEILNGEAENFMFPRQRVSSDLPTDIDRHTTSDNVRASTSSTSLESSSENEQNNEQSSQQQHNNSKRSSNAGKKAIATAKRRTQPQPASKQSFQHAPIQPAVQLKRLRNLSVGLNETLTSPSAINLPEATRKSSRTATAIVTAATRAAVEAAKNNNRHHLDPSATVKKEESTATQRLRRGVVKLEDGMGDDAKESTSISIETIRIDDGEEDYEESEEQEEDDDDDEDYVGTRYSKKQLRALVIASKAEADSSAREKRALTREERFIRRQTQEKQFEETEVEEEASMEKVEDALEDVAQPEEIAPLQELPKPTPKKRDRRSTTRKRKRQKKKSPPEQLSSGSPTRRFPPPQKQGFDFAKCERIQKMEYSFERLPVADLWWDVFSRQDACQERYCEYYGSTNYRKLPYEMGPIPFERTLAGAQCCSLCQKSGIVEAPTTSKQVRNESPKPNVKQEREIVNENQLQPQEETSAITPPIKARSSGSSPLQTEPSSSSILYKHKHKKVHLLQRYRQEQKQQAKLFKQRSLEEPLSEQKAFNFGGAATANSKCDSKASSPERDLERSRERAGSTNSNTSSCGSSAATLSKQKYRNKLLNRVSYLSLELPPRKSPREHASTLALVSIIRQRQDSQSKTNSETDDPPTTPIPFIKEEPIRAASCLPTAAVTSLAPARLRAPTPASVMVPAPPPATPSIPPTPADVSMDLPGLQASSPRATRSSAPTPIEEMRFTTEISENVKRMRRGQNKYDHSPPIMLPAQRRQQRGGRLSHSPFGCRQLHQQERKQKGLELPRDVVQKRQRSHKKTLPGTTGARPGRPPSNLPPIRKTGSKKGVLEFEVDTSALRALDAALKSTNTRKLEWEIDKHLQLTNSEYDLEAADVLVHAEHDEPVSQEVTDRPGTEATKLETAKLDSNTPPPTDCFSSDIDLYDLVLNAQVENDSTDEVSRKKLLSLYNAGSSTSYFRRRKTPKTNRTGWPKIQKKRGRGRPPKKSRMPEQIISVDILACGIKDELLADDEDTKEGPLKNAVMTPPDSDFEEQENKKSILKIQQGEEDELEDTENDAAESIPEEDDVETRADSIEDEADMEDNEDVDEENEDEEEIDYEPITKRTRRSAAASPFEKTANHVMSTGRTSVPATSTPSTHVLRGSQRRTPQLNGSLGSCISPTEKTGDNSDIFTVSSDGLDTDLDMSNSHSQHKAGGDDEHCAHHTPKRKFDISKYAPRANSSTCAAEAATAAVKSLAISQFLKKEVRVNCRRLRAPFRRFRYRR